MPRQALVLQWIRSNLVVGVVFTIGIVPWLPILAQQHIIPWDAFSSFGLWYENLHRHFVNLDHIFGVYAEYFPGNVTHSFIQIAGPARALTLTLFGYSPNIHATIQVAHGIAAMVLFAALLRSYGATREIAATCGVLVALAGTNISLSQHTVQFESLPYLILALHASRQFILASAARQRYFWLFLFTVACASATRMYHEAVHYLVPVTVWVGYHVLANRVVLRRLSGHEWTSIGTAASFLVLCNVPNIIIALEMLNMNKMYIADYANYPTAAPSLTYYLLAFVNPIITDFSALPSIPLGPLSYRFIGFVALFFSLAAMYSLYSSNRRTFWILLASLILCFGFDFGFGSPVHVLLKTLFPPYGYMRHNTYGYRIGSLIIGFLAAYGISIFLKRNSSTNIAYLHAAIVSISLVLLGIVTMFDGQYGVQHTNPNYLQSLWLNFGIGWLFLLATTTVLWLWNRDRLSIHSTQLALCLLMVVEVVRPVVGKEFVS